MLKYETEYGNNGFWISDREVQNVPIHWHSYYEVELCMGGEGIQIINGVERTVKKGSLSLLTPRDFHRLEVAEGSLKLKTFCFYEHIISPSIAQLFTENEAPYQVAYTGEEFERILRAYTELEEESCRADDGIRRLALKRRIELTCMDIIRKALHERKLYKNQKTVESAEFRDLHTIRTVLTYINEHFHEQITREQMAEMLHFSPSYFSNIFKNTLGISFSRYVTDCRMARAMQLIRFSDETISSIAHAVGYNSSSLFYRKFEEYYHTVPSKIQRQLGKKDRNSDDYEEKR